MQFVLLLRKDMQSAISSFSPMLSINYPYTNDFFHRGLHQTWDGPLYISMDHRFAFQIKLYFNP